MSSGEIETKSVLWPQAVIKTPIFAWVSVGLAGLSDLQRATAKHVDKG